MGNIVFGILVICLGFFYYLCSNNKDSEINAITLGFLCGIGGAIITGGVYENNMKDIPTAMDVYKGKTTLQITYKDSIPVDSVVVFK